jgi:hypothetical protein
MTSISRQSHLPKHTEILAAKPPSLSEPFLGDCCSGPLFKWVALPLVTSLFGELWPKGWLSAKSDCRRFLGAPDTFDAQ